jgi:hypothetical protein
MPRIGDTETQAAKGGHPPAYLHYFTGTADYFICEYDGNDTFFGKVKYSMYHPGGNEYQKLNLSSMKSNEFLQLDFSWQGG